MPQPTKGQLIANAGLGGFVDPNGKGIEWELQKDGSYSAKEVIVPLGFDEKGKETGQVKYTYSLTPNGRGFLEVGVAKQRIYTKDQKEEAVKTGEIVPGTPQTPVPEKETRSSTASKSRRHK